VRIVRATAAIFTIAAALSAAVYSTAQSAATTPHRTHAQWEQRRDVLQRHSHARWMSEVLHARALAEARRDRFQAADVHGNYWLDARTTYTVDWRCIRVHEEGGQPAPGNMFGFVPFYGGTDAEQRALALSIFRANGDHFGPSAWTTAGACGLR
jgi:hypothetical protein